MFITSVFAFCLGIYVQAVSPLPLAPLLVSTLTGLSLVAVLLYRQQKVFSLLAPLVLFCFYSSGATRLALVETRQMSIELGEGDDVYEGLVVESSSTNKVLALSKPSDKKGMRVAFVSTDPLDTGNIVRVFGRISEITPSFKNPGANSWGGLKRIEGVMYRVKGRVLSVTADNDTISRLRRYFKGNIENSGADHQDVLKALTIGDRAAIPRETNDLFVKSGTAHVLAVSGFNVSIISGFFFLVVRTLFRRARRWRLSGRDSRYAALAAIPFPFMFMLVAGGGVSLIRATIMATIFLIALFIEKQRHFYNTMALAALVILVLYPHSLLTPSFQLTFVSILFIVMFTRRLYPLIARIRNRAFLWATSTILSTLAATLGTAPIVVYYFCGVNPLCFVHNLVTIPLLGVATTALALVGMAVPQGHNLLVLAGHLTGMNIAVLRAFDFGYLYPVIRPDLTDALLYYALVVAVLHIHLKPVAALFCLVIVPLVAGQVYSDYRQRFNEDLRVHFIDVGTGDAALIEAPGGIRVLVDGGGYPKSDFDMGRQVIAPFLLYRKVRHLDYVINTHPHADHIGGLHHVLDHFEVSHLVSAGYFPEEKAFLELGALAKKKGVKHVIWKKGDRLKGEGFCIDVLHPERHGASNDLNDTSLVLKLTHGNIVFLFTGDIRGDGENDLLLSAAPLKSDVLKVPHHGSASSSGFDFLYAVRPTIAVLSASGSMKGLPSPDTLDRYRKFSIPVLRTDKDGLVEIRSDGRRLKWMTMYRDRKNVSARGQ